MASLITSDLPLPIATLVSPVGISTSKSRVFDWLHSIGCERYFQNFVQAECFSLKVVVEIEKEDLVAMGIPTLPAKAIMKEVEALKQRGIDHDVVSPPVVSSAGESKDGNEQLIEQLIEIEQLRNEKKVKHPKMKEAIAKIKAGERVINLHNNQISDISALASALPNSQVQEIGLSSNLISDISALASALPNSQVQDIDLQNNLISDISALASALPNSRVQKIGLSSNQISDISALATALPNSQVQEIGLSSNLISDISALASALPNSQVQDIDLQNNLISDISALASALPNSRVQKIGLSSNQISDISALATALPNSQVQEIYLGYNQISDISALATALPNSQVQVIGLHNNQISEQDKAILRNLKNSSGTKIQFYF